jgi:hypothetical protein
LNNPLLSFSKLVETGIHKILVIDERIRETAWKESISTYESIPMSNEQFWIDSNPSTRSLVFHHGLSAGLIIADSFKIDNNEVLFEGQNGGDENIFEVQIKNRGINFMGVYKNVFDNKFDTLIIHRTMLDKLLDKNRAYFTLLSENFPNIIVCTGGGTLSYDQEISARIKKISFFALKQLIKDKGIAKNAITNLI